MPGVSALDLHSEASAAPLASAQQCLHLSALALDPASPAHKAIKTDSSAAEHHSLDYRPHLSIVQ